MTTKHCDNVGDPKFAEESTFATTLDNSIFYDKFQTILTNFNSTIVASSITSASTKEQLSENTRALNTFVSASFTLIGVEPFAELYPNLNDRIKQNIPISQVETFEFIEDFLYDFNTFPTYVTNTGNAVVLTCLDTFYSPESQSRSNMGSFCDLIASIFGSITGIFEKFSDISEFASKLPDFSNILKGKNGTAGSLLDGLKNRILKLIDKLVQNSLNKLKNFNLGFTDKSYDYNHGPIYSKVEKTKANTEQFFSKSNMDTVKKRVEGLMAYVVSLFEDPDIEEISFLVYRFCKLIGEVENLFNGVFNPLYNMQNNYNETYSTLRGISSYNTAVAVSAGAKRYTDDERTAAISQGNEVIAEEVPFDSSGQPPSNAEVGEIPRWEDIRQQNNRDSRLVLGPNQSGDKYIPGVNMSNLSWDNAKLEAKVTLLRFHKNLGAALGRRIKFHINSAYRSPDYNAALRKKSSKVAKNSLHMSGIAFDISTEYSEGFSSADRTTFMRVARESGFRGIGKYPSFIHVDLGNERTWGSF